jgi:hypothetical protein
VCTKTWMRANSAESAAPTAQRSEKASVSLRDAAVGPRVGAPSLLGFSTLASLSLARVSFSVEEGFESLMAQRASQKVLID